MENIQIVARSGKIEKLEDWLEKIENNLPTLQENNKTADDQTNASVLLLLYARFHAGAGIEGVGHISAGN